MRRARRGSALILVLLMTLAIAGLSIAAIFMSSSANLLSAFYDKEREFRLAAESGLELVRSRLERDPAFAIPDTGMRQVLAGAQLTDAAGTVLTRARVNVYASTTGDSSGLGLPTVTLLAAAYDAGGTRYVRRLDLRRESFSRYAYFVDSFPATEQHGPETVNGRVHTNGSWRLTSTGNRYRDTVTAVGAVTGTGTFDVDSIVGVGRVTYPVDSTFPRLDSLAAAANLSFAPVSGGARGSRLEFVAYDVDGDGTVEASEGFARIFDAAVGGDTTQLRASPVTYSFFGTPYLYWEDPIVQNQCGAFYLRSGRWHFFPVSAHRRPYGYSVIQSTGAGSYPSVNSGTMNQMDDYDLNAVLTVLGQPTSRCFPAGSPYLMPSERMTNPSGNVTGTPADTVPFGVVVPPGGWPASAPNGYGGSDSTFSLRSRQCQVASTGTGRCSAGTLFDVGTWRAFPGTPIGAAPDSVVQALERPYLWPLHAAHNANGRGVISATSGPLYVSGRVAGPVTLRVAGRAVLVDRLSYVRDPNDPDEAACTDRLGLLATGDVLVVSGLTARVRRVSSFFGASISAHLGGEPRFTVHGSLMSTTGTVGVELPTSTQGSNGAQLPCPDDGANSSESNGGCLAITGGSAMRRYSATYSSAFTNSGLRTLHAPDRCQAREQRPPFFPLTNRYRFVRSLEVDATQANTPTKIRALLMRLKGKAL
jgi:hypothetical protein